MIFAKDQDGNRITALKGRQATCPLCSSPVIPKCGEIVTWHWAHASLVDCDSWAEPDNQWHRGWQLRFPPAWNEVSVGNHRADVRTPAGLVVEFQHSGISGPEIVEREKHYGNMIWLFDGAGFKDRISFTGPRHDGYGRESWWYSTVQDLLSKHDEKKETRCRFDWKIPRKSYGFARSPVFFDLGVAILQVRILRAEPPAGGAGVIRPPQWFVNYIKDWRINWSHSKQQEIFSDEEIRFYRAEM